MSLLRDSIKGMMTDTGLSPDREQDICKCCGLCCDGTLFTSVPVTPEESCRLNGIRTGVPAGDGCLGLPCRFFSSVCTVYEYRPAVCSGYRCQLLHDMKDARISIDEALKTVRQAVLMSESLSGDFRRATGIRKKMGFRKMLIELGRLQKAISSDHSPETDLVMLIARFNIFEALLIKHFRSDKDFEKLLMR